MTYLFYNWQFVPFDHLHPFHPPPTPPPLAIINLFSVSMSSFVVVALFHFVFKFHTYMEWKNNLGVVNIFRVGMLSSNGASLLGILIVAFLGKGKKGKMV